MVFIDITPHESLLQQESLTEVGLTSMIGLAGDLKGVLVVSCPEQTAKGITGAMLGMEVDEMNEDVQDAIGEIANMVAGGLKTSLAGEKINTELAIPTTVLGKSVRTAGQAEGKQIAILFDTPAGEFSIGLKYVLDK
jgi:chemotaxis protein CheX